MYICVCERECVYVCGEGEREEERWVGQEEILLMGASVCAGGLVYLLCVSCRGNEKSMTYQHRG